MERTESCLTFCELHFEAPIHATALERGKKIALTRLCISKLKQIQERGELYPDSPQLCQNQMHIYPVVQKSSTTIILCISAFQPNFESEGME